MSATNFPLIFDGHNDTIWSLRSPAAGQARNFFAESPYGHIDLPRAQRGGLGGGFFAVWVPNPKRDMANHPGRVRNADGTYSTPLPPQVEHEVALSYAVSSFGRLMQLEKASQGQVKIVRTADELATALQNGVLAMLLHLEGAEAIDTDLEALELFYQAGLRSLGIAWSRPTAFGHGVPLDYPRSPDTGPGLTEAGKALVRACNQLGVMLDLSHLNEKGFWDVAALSDAPLVASHSNAYTLCASPRNLTDKQLDAVGESGGVVGINYHIGYLRENGRSDVETSFSEIVRHASYIAERIGLDHVALGSDFDGATMPQDLQDVAGLPKLMQAFSDQGFDAAALRKLAHENWLRVLRQTWK